MMQKKGLTEANKRHTLETVDSGVHEMRMIDEEGLLIVAFVGNLTILLLQTNDCNITTAYV